jgi:hypothetical protein
MRIIFFYILVLPTILFSQINSKQEIPKEDFGAKLAALARDTAKVATMDQYRFISIERDTTYLDTASLSRENTVLIICERITLDFGFANEGQTYNTLQYSLKEFSPYPEFGFKHFNF